MKYDELLSINFVPDELTDELNETSAGHTPYRDEIRLFRALSKAM